MMKRWLSGVLAAVLLLALGACGKDSPAAGSAAEDWILYGESEQFTRDELEAAAAQILAEFDRWEGCEMQSLRYDGDAADTGEILAWLNRLDGADAAHPFTQYVKFLSDFHTDANPAPGFNSDSDYTDWQWYVARSDGGDWVLISWGY